MTEFKRKLNLYGLTMIAVGSCIGAGIFATPNGVVQVLPHHGYALLIWALGGVIALTGALTFAELGGMFPKAGGVYVYLREAYGETAGFLYGWVMLLVINAGALAALSLIFADYLKFFVPGLTENTKIFIATGTILSLTLMNVVGVQVSQAFANIFTGLKLFAMALIVLAGLFFYQPPEPVQLTLSLTEQVPENLGSALLAALVGVLFSFGGWHHASYVSGEAIEPQRTVPRAMIGGVLIVTLTYVLINYAYMLFLPLPELTQSSAVAGDALSKTGSFGGRIASVIIAVSVFGTIGLYTMSAPRIYFAMAKDGVFFPQLARLHPRFKTPVNAMALQAIWACVVLLAWGAFKDVITYVTFMDIAFMTLGGYAVILFRRTKKDQPRPYKTWGYPVVPWIFVLISGAFVIHTLFDQPKQAVAGLVILAIGYVAFRIFKSQSKG
ncbi:MAG: amino acid permease [Bacteroidetes bacterium]|nr:MAG: amino acid permease [Bacteroidota bacterium]